MAPPDDLDIARVDPESRARQRMILLVPEGDRGDHAWLPASYDASFETAVSSA